MDLAKTEELYRDILGPFPERVPLNLETLEEVDCGAFTRSLIAWDNERSAWEAANAAEEFKLVFHDAGHGLTPETRQQAYDWLVEKLQP